MNNIPKHVKKMCELTFLCPHGTFGVEPCLLLCALVDDGLVQQEQN